MDNGINFDQLFDALIKAYTKAKEMSLSTMDIVIILVVGVISVLFIYGIQKGYLSNGFRSTGRQSQNSPACPRPKKEQKLDVQDILQQICDKAPKRVAESYNNIREIIKNNKMDANKLLRDNIHDLIDELELENEIEKNDFTNMRGELRLKMFEMNGPIIIENTNINELDWHEICQLFKENVKPDSKKKLLEWFKYIEMDRITGRVLLGNTEEIKRKLNLNSGGKADFKDMMNKIRSDDSQGASSTKVTVSGKSVVGPIVTAGNNNFKDISVTGTSNSYYGKKPPAKKMEPQDNDDDDDDNNEDSSS